MKNNKRKRIVLLTVVFGLITLACSTTTLSVANQSDYKALVSVTLPGANSTDSHMYTNREKCTITAPHQAALTLSLLSLRRIMSPRWINCAS